MFLFIRENFSYFSNFLEEKILFQLQEMNSDFSSLVNYCILFKKVIEFRILEKSDETEESLNAIALKIIEFLFKIENDFEKTTILDSKDRSCILNLLLELVCFCDRIRFEVITRLSMSYLSNYENENIFMSYEIRDFSSFVGLRNLGSTCYLNSVIQQLYMTDSFREFILNQKVESPMQSISGNVYRQTRFLFCQMNSSVLQTVLPIEFAKNFKLFDNQPFNCNLQQDANEFYSLLLDQIDLHLKDQQTNIVKQEFTGILDCTIQSIDEQYPFESKIEEPFIMISLNIRHNKNLSEALTHYMRGEILDNENQIFIEKYNKKIRVVKKYKFKVLPNSLVLTLNRFEFDLATMTRRKLNNHFEFTEELNLDDFEFLDSSIKNSQSQYELTGVILHSGIADAGHYISYIKRENVWMEFNDGTVVLKTDQLVQLLAIIKKTMVWQR